MTPIQNIRLNIQRWNNLRNEDIGLTFLSSGFGFEVSRSEFDTWETIDSNAQIYVYIGIDENNETRFYLVDSVSDATNNDTIIQQHLIEKGFTKEHLPPDQGPQTVPELKVQQDEGMRRAFKWFLYCNVWFQNKQNDWRSAQESQKDQTGVVRVFSLPLADFSELFSDSSIHRSFVFFGIKDTISMDGIDIDNEVELLVAGVNHLKAGEKIADMNIQMKNVSMPHPPFPINEASFALF